MGTESDRVGAEGEGTAGRGVVVTMSLLTGTFGDNLEIDNVLSNTRYEDVAVWAPSEPSDEGRNILWHIRPEDWRWEGRGWGVAAMRRVAVGVIWGMNSQCTMAGETIRMRAYQQHPRLAIA